MKKAKEYKIFLGAQEIAGMMGRLNNAFHEMGIKSDFYWLYDYNGLFYKDTNTGEKPKGFERYLRHTQKIRSAKKPLEKSWWAFIQMLDTLYILMHAICVYDHFVYVFGRGMFFFNRYLRRFGEVEFFLLKLFKKDVIMWLCGDDSRAAYCSGAFYEEDIKYIKKRTIETKKKIAMLEKYTVLIDVPASSHFHSKKFIQFGAVGIPVDEKEFVQKEKSENGEKPVVVLHAPSVMKYKGTAIVREIVKEIQEEGYQIEYIEVSGQPHEVVLNKIREADIVVDQLYSDLPIAGFGGECAVNGVPVIIGGYYSEVCKDKYVKPIPPTIYCNPEDIKEKLRELITNKKLREEIGEKLKEYAEENLMAQKVAQRIIMLLQNRIPKDWWFDPKDNEYIWGAGMTKECVIDSVKRLVSAYGEEALCLDENSKLFKNYMSLCAGDQER